MAFVTKTPFQAFGDKTADRGLLRNRVLRVRPSRRRWLPLATGFIAGAALALGLAQADHEPADRQAAPPAPLNERPYVPPVRIGMGADIPVSGARAPLRDSAALRRDGEAS
jgi:hypothetical protein